MKINTSKNAKKSFKLTWLPLQYYKKKIVNGMLRPKLVLYIPKVSSNKKKTSMETKNYSEKYNYTTLPV